VTAGTGEISATAGGTQTLAVMRFQADQIVIHKGETVEWTNLNPVEPHTVTFGNLSFAEGTSPVPNPLPVDAEGVPHVSVKAPTDKFSSGIIVAGAQDPNSGMGNQTPLSPSRGSVQPFQIWALSLTVA
jgi:hypothetical protein